MAIGSERIDLRAREVALYRDGTSAVLETAGAPRRVDGFTVGAPLLERNPPHGGERHPDGDELVFIFSGRVDVILDEDGSERIVELSAGQALLVQRGVWHRVDVREPSRVLYVTPGPRVEVRPPKRSYERPGRPAAR